MKMLIKPNFIFLLLFTILLTACIKGDDIPLPPDPGRAGNRTLEGVDSNNNGVRDDVELAIYYKYPRNKIARQISYQMAKYEQKVILAGARDDIMTNTDLIYKIWNEDLDRAVACTIWYEEQHPEAPLGRETFLVAIVIMTG